MHRRLVLGGLLAVVLGVSSAAPLADALTSSVTAASDSRVVLGSGRVLELHTPAQLRRDPGTGRGRPAMIVLHGLKSNPADTAAVTGFNALGDRDGVLVAYPDGLRRSFDAGLCCGQAVLQQVDDVSFLVDVVAELRRRGAGRIAVVGFSNGAMMAYRFACARPDLVDSVGALGGTLEVPHCAGPIRALALHGALDTQVPFAGDDYSKALRAYLRPVPAISEAAPGSTITIREIAGVPHRWTEPGDPVDATATFWAFARMSAPA